MNQVRFKYWNCIPVFKTYSNGRKAISLIDAKDGSPVANATLNLPGIELESDEVIVKNYSENEGIRPALIEAGIIGPILRTVSTGYVTATVHKIITQ